jgi:hypothetical protein
VASLASTIHHLVEFGIFLTITPYFAGARSFTFRTLRAKRT